MFLSVVIPVYGCKGALFELHDRLVATISQITDDYEIILVNDACPMGSWEVIEQICEKDPKTVGIEFSRNFGQNKAITAGLDYSTGDWNVVMDCDLQDVPEEILKLYNKAQEGYDIVFANRTGRKDTGVVLFFSKLFYRFYELLSGNKINPANSHFSISKRIVIENYCKMREFHRDFSIYARWMGFRSADVDVETSPRKEGKSSYNFKRKISLAVDILTSQSDSLLKLSAAIGFFITALSMLAILVLVIQYFVVDIDPGWTSVVATVTLMGGLILSAIGVSGIYIGNIFMQSKNRPLYIIRDIKNRKEN